MKSKKSTYKLGTALLYTIFCCHLSFANNLAVSNPTVTNPDTENSTATITFDISWDNSWRNTIHYDAAWVFVKYSTDSGSSWNHATLKSSGTNPSGFSTGSGTQVEIIVPADKKGCLIQRVAQGQGTLSTTGVTLVWDWGTDGLDSTDSARVKVVGIEMVCIPESAFYLGDGSGASESAYAFHQSGSNDTAVQITTTGKLISCDVNGNDDIDTSSVSVDGDGGITGNANFPTGYTTFYLMKYEISEDQWVIFFNTLRASAKLNRDITGAAGKNSDSAANRNTVSWTAGDASTTSGDRACGYLSWMDVCAYADWTALRPMTELEFEKAARGNLSATLNAYAWGNTSITYAATVSGTEDGTETITTDGANCSAGNQTLSGGSGGTGPLRNGIFATTNSSRSQAGAGYYGAMELSGNLTERVVALGNSDGRSFEGSHGDGVLSSEESYEGNATNTDWPGIDSVPARGVTGATGSGFRGGAWSTATNALLAVSNRTNASTADTSRGSSYGGRLARTAP